MRCWLIWATWLGASLEKDCTLLAGKLLPQLHPSTLGLSCTCGRGLTREKNTAEVSGNRPLLLDAPPLYLTAIG